MADSKQTAVIPRSVYTAINSMKAGIQKCAAYDTVMAYAFDGTEPDEDTDGVLLTLFGMARVLIDAQNR